MKRLESSDKQIGPWFVKADDDGLIKKDTFKSKVMFYLLSDAFRDRPEIAQKINPNLNTYYYENLYKGDNLKYDRDLIELMEALMAMEVEAE